MVWCGCAAFLTASRVPVKRYSILTVALFPDPRTLSHEVDLATGDLQKSALKRIGNLIEYAEKNPHRIPKIARRLERRLQKEVRGVCTVLWRWELGITLSQHCKIHTRPWVQPVPSTSRNATSCIAAHNPHTWRTCAWGLFCISRWLERPQPTPD